MPTTLVFENATLFDAVQKAARVAPTKGAAFDKAAGIYISCYSSREVIVRATDTDTTFEQSIQALSFKGDECHWRLPSALFANIIGTLPMSQGQEVELIDRGDGWIRLKAGRTMARLARIEGEYTLEYFPQFDVNSLVAAPDLASKVQQVVWAVDPTSSTFGGVRVDGSRIIGCNQYYLAVTSCVAQVVKPVTVPLTTISELLKKSSDFRIGATEKRFLMSLDANTRVSTTLIDAEYPNVDQVMREEFEGSVQVNRQQAIDMLTRLLVMGKTEKLPRLRIEVNGTGILKMMTLDLDAGSVGRLQDSMDVGSNYEDIFTIDVTPQNMMEAIDQTKGDMFHIDFGLPNDKQRGKLVPLRLRDNNGYFCFIVPRRENQK